MTGLVDEARERIGRRIFAEWTQRDVEDLVRLMRRFAENIKEDTPDPSNTDQ